MSRHPQGYVLSLKITKTLQFRERRPQVPLPRLRNTTPCPADLMDMLVGWHFSMATYPDRPLHIDSAEASMCSAFCGRLNKILSEAVCKEKFSGHSFCRGGATWAFLNVGYRERLFSTFGIGFDEFNEITLNSPPSTHTSLMRIDPVSHVHTVSLPPSNEHVPLPQSTPLQGSKYVKTSFETRPKRLNNILT